MARVEVPYHVDIHIWHVLLQDIADIIHVESALEKRRYKKRRMKRIRLTDLLLALFQRAQKSLTSVLHPTLKYESNTPHRIDK
jgi:hypothetical protein